jgi:hypothetical protein
MRGGYPDQPLAKSQNEARAAAHIFGKWNPAVMPVKRQAGTQGEIADLN